MEDGSVFKLKSITSTLVHDEPLYKVARHNTAYYVLITKLSFLTLAGLIAIIMFIYKIAHRHYPFSNLIVALFAMVLFHTHRDAISSGQNRKGRPKPSKF